MSLQMPLSQLSRVFRLEILCIFLKINRFFNDLADLHLFSFLRFNTGFKWASAGALSSRHLPLCHHLPGLPDEEEAGTFGRGVRVRAPAPQHHLAQFQLHGPAAAVRVAAPRHLVRRRGGRHGEPAARTQDHDSRRLNGNHAHLAVHFQLPGFCCEPCLPAPQPPHDLPRLLIESQLKPFFNTKRAQTGPPLDGESRQCLLTTALCFRAQEV